MNVGKPSYGKVDGYPVVRIPIDGKTAVLGIDQKLTILEKYNAVFLGAAFEDAHQVTIPADPSEGQPATTLHGYTDDERVVAIYRAFLRSLED